MIPGFIVFFQKKILRLHKVFSDQNFPFQTTTFQSSRKHARPVRRLAAFADKSVWPLPMLLEYHRLLLTSTPLSNQAVTES